MNLLGDDLSFALLLAFGMFAVGVHSYSLYDKRVQASGDTEKHHFLDSLSLQTLSENHAYIRGFVFYLAVNELIYLTLSFSTLILQQSLNLVGQEDMVGALTTDERINPLYPILASTVIIVASQMKPLSDVENALRRMAHTIAGIPRALFDVQQRIRAFSIIDLTKTDSNESKLEHDFHEIVNNAEALADDAVYAATSAGLPIDESSTLKKSLTKMYCLFDWTLGYHGEKIWIDERTMPISSFFQSMKLEKRNLSEAISALVAGRTSRPPTDPDRPPIDSPVEQWRNVALHCRALENRLCDVLGLMLINKPDADLSAYPTLRELRSRVDMRDEKPEMNAFSLATLQGFGAATVLLLVYLYMESGVKTVFEKLAAGGTESATLPLLPSEAGFLGNITGLLSDLSLPKEENIVAWAADAGRYINQSIEEVMEPALIFVISVGIALSLRALLRVNRRWPTRVNYEPLATNSTINIRKVLPPSVTTYLYLGFIAYLLSCATMLLYRYILLVAIPALNNSLSFDEAARLVEFSNYIPEIFLICSTAFVCVWFACAYLDLDLWKNSPWVHHSAFQLALLCGLLNLASALSTTTIFTAWDLFGAFLSPTIAFSIFFVRYARVIERYQHPEPVQISFFKALSNLTKKLLKSRHERQQETSAKQGHVVTNTGSIRDGKVT